MILCRECTQSLTLTRKWWKNGFISESKLSWETTGELARTNRYSICKSCPQAADSSILMALSSTINSQSLLESSIEFEATRKYYRQIFSILSSGRFLDITKTTRTTCSCSRTTKKSTEWSPWIVRHIVSCLAMRNESKVTCQCAGLTSEFYTEMSCQVHCLDSPEWDDSSRTMRISSALGSSSRMRSTALWTSWATFMISLDSASILSSRLDLVQIKDLALMIYGMLLKKVSKMPSTNLESRGN